METNKILSLINLNNSFYTKHQEEFSKSRKNPWNGWDRIVELINNLGNKEKALKILDIGCGNGRFYNFLKNNCDTEFNYLGLDNNDYFLIEAILKYKKANFRKMDVINDIGTITEEYDVIVIFGLTHHIPGYDFRKDWFKKISELINDGGLICLSFWNLLSDDRSIKLEKADDLENNDYFYGWSDSNDKRYVHIFDNEELKEIQKLFEQHNFFQKISFVGNGKNDKLNIYQVYEKKITSYP